MQRNKQNKLWLWGAAAIAGIGLAQWGSVQLGLAQSGTRGSTPAAGGGQAEGSAPRSGQGSAPRGARPAEPPFEQRFWRYLQQVHYRNWAPPPGWTDGAHPGQSPHGERVKLYANRPAAGRPDELPAGSILVKENFDAGGTNLEAITVMYRTQGYAPDSGDWYWVKYEPNGDVSRMGDIPVAGRVRMCIECHQGAGGDDFVFANDR